MFDYSKVKIGDIVAVRRSPDDPQTHPAFVTRVKPKSIDVLMLTPGGFEVRLDLWHETDPRIVQHAEEFRSQIFVGRGVFKVENTGVKELEDRLVKLEQRVEALMDIVNKRNRA